MQGHLRKDVSDFHVLQIYMPQVRIEYRLGSLSKDLPQASVFYFVEETYEPYRSCVYIIYLSPINLVKPYHDFEAPFHHGRSDHGPH
jgi:hypothetical protein